MWYCLTLIIMSLPPFRGAWCPIGPWPWTPGIQSGNLRTREGGKTRRTRLGRPKPHANLLKVNRPTWKWWSLIPSTWGRWGWTKVWPSMKICGRALLWINPSICIRPLGCGYSSSPSAGGRRRWWTFWGLCVGMSWQIGRGWMRAYSLQTCSLRKLRRRACLDFQNGRSTSGQLWDR